MISKQVDEPLDIAELNNTIDLVKAHDQIQGLVLKMKGRAVKDESYAAKVQIADCLVLQSLMSQIRSKFQHKQGHSYVEDLATSITIDPVCLKMTDSSQRAVLQHNKMLAKKVVKALIFNKKNQLVKYA